MGEQQIGQESAGGLSGAAWAALGTVGAALVAGVVTLVTVYLPAGRPVVGMPASEGPAPPVASSPVRSPGTSAPSPAPPVPRSSLLEQLTGRWQGEVQASGRTFTMTLDIPNTCAEGKPCGTMTTDLHGCVGDLVLVRINDGPQFDLATVDLHDGSSSACELRSGGGDYFTLGRDVLVYATGYDGSRSGRLRRVG
ncbi:MAG: hypothetical protein WAS07_10925 [Micropruina sp.]